jgi:hypothetical protein
MIDFKNKSQKELQEMLQGFSPDSTEYKVVAFEIQRIQQDTNNNQIANLIDYIKEFSKRAEENSRNDRILTYFAIGIAIIALVVQIIDILC